MRPILAFIAALAISLLSPSEGEADSDLFINHQDQVVSVRAQDYGLVSGGAAAANATALNAAVQALPAKGGRLYVKAGTYNYNASWSWDRPVQLICEGNGDDSATAASSGTEAVTFTYTGTGDMVSIASPTGGHWLFGGSITNCLFNGSYAADRCVNAQSISNWYFDFKCRQVLVEGFLIAGNNSAAIPQFNYIHRYQYIDGANALAASSHGLTLGDTTNTWGSTQAQIDWIDCNTKNGDCLHIADADNNHIRHVQGNIDAGGTGFALNLLNGASASHTARNNLFDYVVGPINAQSNTRGNRIIHLVSETSSVTIAAGGQLSYCLLDRTRGGVLCTPTFKKTDTIVLSPEDITVNSAAATVSRGVSAQWASLNLLEGQTAIISVCLPPDPRWTDGTITSIVFTYTMVTNANGNVELLEKASTLVAGNSTATAAQVSETNTFAVGAVSTIATYTWTPATTVSFSKGYMTCFMWTRTSGSAGDTATGNFAIMGLAINYTATDPADGTFANPPIEQNHS